MVATVATTHTCTQQGARAHTAAAARRQQQQQQHSVDCCAGGKQATGLLLAWPLLLCLSEAAVHSESTALADVSTGPLCVLLLLTMQPNMQLTIIPASPSTRLRAWDSAEVAAAIFSRRRSLQE